MFYTKAAKFISAILLFLGITRVAMGILIASTDNPKLAVAQVERLLTEGFFIFSLELH
jgi:hypothetical protein